MNVTTHSHDGGGDHVHLAVERGPHAGTWTVRYEPARGGWAVRTPSGSEHVLASDPSWLGDAASELRDLMTRIAKAALLETMARGIPESVVPGVAEPRRVA